MELNIKYRGLVATKEKVEVINHLIKSNPDISRYKLSRVLCEKWNWKQPNGDLRDMVCRGFLLKLHEAELVILPPIKRKMPSPFVPAAQRRKPQKPNLDQTPIVGKISDISRVKIESVRKTKNNSLFNSLIEDYHYLGYCHPVGEQMKYLVSWNDRPLACFSWSSAPRHIGARDKYIGWDQHLRKKNIHLMAYNSRFLILPWVKIKNFASYLLGEMSRRINDDWMEAYHHEIHYLETFVDTERFLGTCYKAANWKYLGLTTGRGKNDQTMKQNRSLKAVWGLPLTKGFKEVLCG